MSTTRILLVEDEQSLADTIKLNLELEGYKVQWANDGKKALKMFKQERFDLVVLDVMLPEMDGFTVCEAIRLDNEQIPVLFLTAKHSSSDRVTGLKMGADDYLTKPFDDVELLNAIEIRLKKNDILRREFTKNMEGIDEFMNKAKGMASLKKLSDDRDIRIYKKKEDHNRSWQNTFHCLQNLE